MPHHPTFLFLVDFGLVFYLCISVGAGFGIFLVKFITLLWPYLHPIITLLWPHLTPHSHLINPKLLKGASSLNWFTRWLNNPDFRLQKSNRTMPGYAKATAGDARYYWWQTVSKYFSKKGCGGGKKVFCICNMKTRHRSYCNLSGAVHGSAISKLYKICDTLEVWHIEGSYSHTHIACPW